MVNTFSNVRLFDVTLILTYNDSPNPCICRFDKTHMRYEFACLSNRPGRSSGERQSYALINSVPCSCAENIRKWTQVSGIEWRRDAASLRAIVVVVEAVDSSSGIHLHS